MKNKFTLLNFKMLGRIIAVVTITAVACIFVVLFLVEGVLQDAAANFLDSLGWYDFFVMNKIPILTLFVVGTLLLAMYLVIRGFSKYLNQISRAVERVFDDSAKPIVLQSELAPLESQLNTIKATLRQREAEARESEQRKNDLVVYLAHDLKTPLTSVIGYLELLRDEQQISPELREKYLSIAADKAQRLEELINEFFDITRFSLQNIRLEKRTVNLSVMLEQLADEFYPLLAPKLLAYHADIASGLTLVGDPDKLARVFDNLLRNAINYSYEETQIGISAQWSQGGVAVAVRNQGAQITADRLPEIFEKFYRLDSARTSASGGSGLGLAIAREIVERHGGRISASSNPEFTEFSVWLPAGFPEHM